MEATHAVPASVQPLIDRLAATPGVARVVLFGSRARGDHRERSDVDLAVEAPGLRDADWLRLWAEAEQAETLYAVDLVRLDEAPDHLRQRIEREGVRV